MKATVREARPGEPGGFTVPVQCVCHGYHALYRKAGDSTLIPLDNSVILEPGITYILRVDPVEIPPNPSGIELTWIDTGRNAEPCVPEPDEPHIVESPVM